MLASLSRNKSHLWWAALLVGGVGAFFFGRALLENRGFSFRDTATFYRPRYEWAAKQRTAHAAIPTWNDRIGIGTPVVADATSASFYPGQLLFHLPLSGSRRMLLYVILHVVGAAGGAYLLARFFGCSAHAACLAALAYAFGGSILFQHCNVIFLVSACWLPYSCVSLLNMLQRHSLFWMIAWAMTLACMVLGGDPQQAYHTTLLGLCACGLGLGRESTPAASASVQRPAFSLLRRWRGVGLLATGAMLGLGLSAIQVAPSARWSRSSTRAMREQPRSIYELAADLTEQREDVNVGSLFAAPAQGHARAAYHFSVGPWRWIEWLWPNSTGRVFPANQRWIRALPSEGRTWAPSLYMGAPIIILALAGLGGGAGRRWLAVITAISILASMGQFGLGWLLTELDHGLSGREQNRWGVGNPVGGVYWLLTTVLPGYCYFRYPAKWLTIGSLGLAVLAAIGCDRCQTSRLGGGVSKVFAGLGAISLLISAAAWTAAPWLTPLLDLHIRAESFFGPFHAAGAVSDFVTATAHGGVVSILAAFLINAGDQPWKRHALVVVTAIDLCLANGGLIPTASEAAWQETERLVAPFQENVSSQENETLDTVTRIYRGNAVGWLPHDWAQQTHASPINEVLRWNAATAYPHLHLLPDTRFAVVNAPTSIESARWEAWLAIARGAGTRRNGVADCKPSLLKVVGAGTAMLPESLDWAQHDREAVAGGYRADNMRTYHSQPFPRGWLVSDVEWAEPIDESRHSEVYARMRMVLFPNGVERDFRATALLEAGNAPPAANRQSGNAITGKGRAKRKEPAGGDAELVLDSGGRLVFRVESEGPRYLLVCNHYDDSWRAYRLDQEDRTELSVFRANGVLQAVPVPDGASVIELIYEPHMLADGGWLSLACWLGSLATLVFLSILPTRSAEENGESLDSRERDA